MLLRVQRGLVMRLGAACEGGHVFEHGTHANTVKHGNPGYPPGMVPGCDVSRPRFESRRMGTRSTNLVSRPSSSVIYIQGPSRWAVWYHLRAGDALLSDRIRLSFLGMTPRNSPALNPTEEGPGKMTVWKPGFDYGGCGREKGGTGR